MRSSGCNALNLRKSRMGYWQQETSVKQSDALRRWPGQLVSISPAMKHETSGLQKRLLFIKFLLDFRCNKTLGFALDDVQGWVHIQLDENVRDTPEGATYLVKAKRLSFDTASQCVAKEMIE